MPVFSLSRESILSSFDYDARTRAALDYAADNPYATLGWHSISCVCNRCLEADALQAYMGCETTRISTKGLK